jgi:hypothetical protein
MHRQRLVRAWLFATVLAGVMALVPKIARAQDGGIPFPAPDPDHEIHVACFWTSDWDFVCWYCREPQRLGNPWECS